MLAPPFLILLVALTAPANPSFSGDGWCEELTHEVASDEAMHCEVRSFALTSRPKLRVEAAPNGSIHAKGHPRADIEVLARVWTRARTEVRARALADGITIHTDGMLRHELAQEFHSNDRPKDYVEVSYRLAVSHGQDLDLTALNGDIQIEEVQSRIRFESLNGGVWLYGLGGDVQGHTLNGRLRVRLTGDTWEGRGLDATTTNGRVELIVPSGYSAELETGTVNGRLRVNLGDGRGDDAQWLSRRGTRQLDTTLGKGGAPVRVQTTNGRVQVAANR
ncbi:MAG: hypothetical protein Rubg2KO_20840 [Rubricoccaceae bacterium]